MAFICIKLLINVQYMLLCNIFFYFLLDIILETFNIFYIFVEDKLNNVYIIYYPLYSIKTNLKYLNNHGLSKSLLQFIL